MEEIRKRRAQYMVVLCVSVGTMTLGAVASWPSPAFIKFNNNETEFVVTGEDISWIVSVNNFGFIAGSLATRYTSDRLGRWVTIISSSLPYIIGTVIAAFGSEAWLLCVARIFWGFGTGMMATVVGMYVAEIADKEIRGRLSVCTKFMTNLGNLLTMGIGPVVSYRVMNYMLLVLPVCHFLACLWIPESPYYYLKQGRADLAEKELMKLRGYKNKEEFNEELDSMKKAVTSEMRRKSSTKELVTGRRYRKAIVIAIGLKFTQIMTGAVIIKQYLGIIMQEARVKMEVEHALLIYGLTEFCVSIISSVLADRVGRRPLLFWSYLGTALSLGLVAMYFFFQEIINVNEESLRSFGFVTLLGVILANIISTIGFNSVIYVIISEIFPLNVRSVAMTCLSILGGIFGFAVSKGFKHVRDICGLFGAFTIFTLVAVFGVFFALIYVPETRGKSLTEIQVQLQGSLYDSRDENSMAKSNQDSQVLMHIETKETKS